MTKPSKLIAKVISTNLRTVDLVARLGGEEFVIIMPETSGQQAYTVLEKVRVAVSSVPFQFNKQPFKVTISFGISEFIADDTMDSVFERADKALYAAKTLGRDQCRIESGKKKALSPQSQQPLQHQEPMKSETRSKPDIAPLAALRSNY